MDKDVQIKFQGGKNNDNKPQYERHECMEKHEYKQC